MKVYPYETQATLLEMEVEQYMYPVLVVEMEQGVRAVGRALSGMLQVTPISQT